MRLRHLRRSTRGRSILAGIAVAILAIGVGGGWALASLFVSPAQHEAAATAPPPGPVTADVVRGDLADTVSTDVQIVRESLATIPLGTREAPAVVTANPVSEGATVKPGTVVLEINGRPLILLTGSFPFYRDLTIGDSGRDVSQLQTALAGLGHQVTIDGRFGPGTAAALRALYRVAGYPAPVTARSSDDGGGAPALAAPMTELAVVPALPADLRSAPDVGMVLDAASALELEAGPLVAAASIPAAVQARIEIGMSAVLRGTGPDLSLTVASIGEPDPETAEARLILTSEDEPIPDDQLHTSSVAIIMVQLAAPDALLVPSRALNPEGGSDPTVLVLQSDGTFAKVRVREVAQFAGLSAVEPVDERTLTAGDAVRVG